MGSNQSSHAAEFITTTTKEYSSSSSNSSVRGRKATTSTTTLIVENKNKEFGFDPTETTERIEDDFFHSSEEEIEVSLTVMEVDDEEEEDDDESEEDEREEDIMYDEDEEERKRILEDMEQLKIMADMYLHPEKTVQVDATTAFARCYFDRPSAVIMGDNDAVIDILQDVMALKTLAVNFMHPELPVTTNDPTVCARCYFDRPSAPEQDSEEDMEERALILAEAAALKKLAVDYLHPEMPVVTTDPTVFGRNYFTRPSAPEQDEEERTQVLADMAALKNLAVDYLHPEMSLVTTDATAFGRNYFTRPSAPEVEDDEERAQVMADMAALKKLAVDYLHPELPVVTTDPTVFGRNYFTRPSAPEVEDDEELDHVMADMAALKKLAIDYLHPELPVVTTDPTVFGRNYYTRPSAPEIEDVDEREQVLAEAMSLKKLAIDYLHPELPVVTTDPTVFGRSYFTRPSAPEQEFGDDGEEVQQILAEAAALKKLALDYAHPELPVVTTDATVFGRNYFTRPSAPAQEMLDEAEDHKVSLEEAMSLKKSAVDYAHPELPCETTDPTSKGRNYFNRPSAPGHTGFIHSMGYDNNAAKAEPHGDKASQQQHDDYDQFEMEHHDQFDMEHHDHFEMDEDIWSNMYSSLHLPDEVALKGDNSTNKDNFKIIHSQDEEEEGKLSRSPSSVMLFEQGGMEGY